MSQILHIHHTNEDWHIQAALCALQHFSLEDSPTPGLPAHLTYSSLHIPSSPTAISLFFCWHFSVRLPLIVSVYQLDTRGGANTGTSQTRLGFQPGPPQGSPGWCGEEQGLCTAQWTEPCSSGTDHFKEESLFLSEASLMHLSSRQSLSTSERMSL